MPNRHSPWPRRAGPLALQMASAIGLMAVPLLAGAATDAAVTQLLTESIAEYPGHELTMIKVTYPPGGRSSPHRHDAYVLVYVLDGAIEMKVSGGTPRILKAGETFIERPADVHEVSRNASASKPATLLVVALKESGRPLTRAAAAQ